MIRTLFPIVILFGLIEGACSRPATYENTDVILIVVDALRRDHLGAFGSEKGLTAYMDEFAEEGFRFTNAVAPGSWTKPSVASLMTGLYPSRHGAVGTTRNLQHLIDLNERFTTLAERLDEEGYRTAAFITNPVLNSFFGFDQGFQEFTQPAGDAKKLLARAVEWIEAKGDEKYFLYLHLIDPHAPYFPPEEYRKKLAGMDPGEKTLRTREGDPLEIESWVVQYLQWKMKSKGGRFQFDFEQLYRDLAGEKPKGEKPDLSWIKNNLYLDFSGPEDPLLRRRADYLVRLYEQEVAYTNDCLNAFFRTLKEKGVLDRTLVVVAADHGEAFLEHGVWGHAIDVHAEQVNIPLLFRVPGKGGALRGRCDIPVSLVDIFPTLADMLGLSLPAHTDGVSLWPVIRNGDVSKIEDRFVFAEQINQYESSTAAISRKGKTFRKRDVEGRILWKYYDADDPLERRPLDAVPIDMKQAVESLIEVRWPSFEGGKEPKPIPEEVMKSLKELGY